MRLLYLWVAFALTLGAQISAPVVDLTPSPGVPTGICVAGQRYMQTDAVVGRRLWIAVGTSPCAWEQQGSAAPVAFSVTGIGHTWFWAPPQAADSHGQTIFEANRIYHWEFTVSAQVTVVTLYGLVATPANTYHLAWGIWDATGALVANGNSSTFTCGTASTIWTVTFPGGGVTLAPGTYYLGWTSDSTVLAIGTGGIGSGMTTLDGFLPLVAAVTGAAGLRYNFRDSSVSTGTATLVMSTMGVASTRVAHGSGPPDLSLPIVLGMP